MNAWILGAVLAAPAPMGADVTFEIDPCVDVAPPFVERVVAAELASVTTRSPSTVRVECNADNVVITVTTRAGKARSRTLRLELEAKEARPRVLGVAIAETLESVWSEPEEQGVKTEPTKLAPPPALATPTVDVAPAPPLERKRFELAANGVARGFRTFTMFGGGVSFAYRTQSLFAARLSADGTASRVRFELGDVDVRAGSVALEALVFATTGPFQFESGVGVRAGLVRLTGAPHDGAVGRSITETWGGPFVSIGASFGLSRHLRLVAGAEGGWATREAAGLVANEPRLALENAWWCARVGVALTL